MIDQKIGRIYNIVSAAGCSERDVTFVFLCNEKWSVSASCHQAFMAESDGPADLETAVAHLLHKVIEGHPAESPVAAQTEAH